MEGERIASLSNGRKKDNAAFVLQSWPPSSSFSNHFCASLQGKKHTCVTYDVAMQHNNGLAFVFHKD